MTMSDENYVPGLKLSDNTYANAKFFVQIVLPALGVLYATLSQFWGFPKVQEVVGSANALALFLGVILRISSSNYYKASSKSTAVGSFVIDEAVDEDGNKTGKKTVTLDLEQDPADFIDGKSITFHAKSAEPPRE